MPRIFSSHEVFGVSNKILPASYVDRSGLDESLAALLERPQHVAIRGESKCGKTWLRQKILPDAIVVQCRLGRTLNDLYKDALSQLDISFIVREEDTGTLSGQVSAKGSVGAGLLEKVFGLTGELSAETSGAQQNTHERVSVGRDIDDIRYIAEILKASGRRLVVEDFHYLSLGERKALAFDLKTHWDYGLFVVIVGVWSESNLLIYLNPDLSQRIEEVAIYWSDADLRRVIERGSEALAVSFNDVLARKVVEYSYGNVGILQSLVLRILQEEKIYRTQDVDKIISTGHSLESAALYIAEQLNPLYQEFARRVSAGIRSRTNSTGIYAHAMAAILEEEDESILRGIHVNRIFSVCHQREPRIQKGNLKTVLEKFDMLQVDSDGRGLVLSYNPSSEEVTVVDRQLLLYRKFLTVKWPWEGLIAETAGASSFDGD